MTAESSDWVARRDDLRTLGLPPSASPEAVLRTYLKLRRALRKDSPAMRSAASEGERCEMLRRIEEAYRRLCCQAGQPLRSGGASGASAVADGVRGSHDSDPPLDMRSRPSPFRARPSRPRY